MGDDSAETWRPVLGYEGYYEVSDHWRVLSLYRARRRRGQPGMLSPSVDRYGYLCVHLYLNGVSSSHPVHQIVCEAWHGARPEGLVVRHLDGDQLNNAPWNLKWGTPAENGQDMVDHGRTNARITHCPQGHPYDGDNVLLDENGWRKCRLCVADRQRRYYEENCEELKAAERARQRRKRDGRTPDERAAERAERRVYEADLREQQRQAVAAERASQGLPPLVKNADKTHCPQDHEYTPKNTYVVPKSGSRQCRTCRRETMARFFERKKQERLAAA